MTFAAALAALLPLTTVGAQEVSLDIDHIRQLIAAHHPQVYEDTALNTVVMVLNANGQYARSIAARFDSIEVAATDFRFAQLQDLIAAREGTRKVDTLLSSACSNPLKLLVERKDRSAQPADRRPLCILDGARVDSFNSLQTLAMHKLETLIGAAATTRYGDGAVNGVVVGSTVTSLLERYKGLGITAANIGSLQMNRVRAGVVGPRRLDITIVFLKTE
jgi:hypothetical protein